MHRSTQPRLLILVLALLVVAALVAPLGQGVQPARAKQEPERERFTVTDVSGNQTAPRISGKWVVYEDDRRRADPTATPENTPTHTPVVVTATPTDTPVPTNTPIVIVVTATPTPVVATNTPAAAVPPAGPQPAAGAPQQADGAFSAMALAAQVTTETDIRVRNLDTNDDRRVTSGPNARQPDVSGDLAVWSERGDDGNWSIVIYDLEERSTVRRIDRNGDQQHPSIDGRKVVWQDSRSGRWNIRAYDIDENRESWVSESSADEVRPSISGNLVAWEREDQIFYRDLTENQVRRIEDHNGWEPSVDGDRIVFRSGRSRDDERDAGIYVFDRRDGSVTQISSTQEARRGSPRIKGDLVVWWDRRRGDRDIFAYDLANQTEFRIDIEDDDQDQPAVDGSGPMSVVWTDRSDDDANIRGARVTLAPAAEPTATPDPTTPTPTPAPLPPDPNPTAPRDARYFSPTGFRIDNDAIWGYFNLRGGVKNFGYPISRTFRFLGFETQMFQRHIVQVGPEGPRLVNLLDPELMPYTQINQSTFPAFDSALAAQAPVVGSPGYDTAIVEFVRQHAPDEFAGQPVNFFQTFMNQVDLATAFPDGGGNPALIPGFNLELAGSVTSLPMADPNNGGFIYQRFQRVILHYDASCGCTQPILLADYFKSILTGQNLPPDLAAQASGSRFFDQYDNASPNGVRRPESLPATDMRFAFEPQ